MHSFVSNHFFIGKCILWKKKNPMGLKAFSNNFYIQIVSTIFSPT